MIHDYLSLSYYHERWMGIINKLLSYYHDSWLFIPTVSIINSHYRWFMIPLRKKQLHFAARDLRHLTPRRTGKACPLHGLKTSQHRQHREVTGFSGDVTEKNDGIGDVLPMANGYFFMIQHKQNYLSQWVSWDRMRWYGMSPVVLDWYTTTSTTILHLASLFVKCAWKTRFRAPWLPIFDMEYGYYQIAHLLPRKHRRPDLGCTSINPRSAGIWP